MSIPMNVNIWLWFKITLVKRAENNIFTMSYHKHWVHLIALVDNFSYDKQKVIKSLFFYKNENLFVTQTIW